MKIKKIYQGNIPESKVLCNFSESQIDTYSCSTINEMIKTIDVGDIELVESDPTVPEHVKAITEEDIAKWNSGTGSGSSDIEFNDAVRRKWTYTPTVVSKPGSNAWVKICSTVTTATLPKGKYLILYRATLGTTTVSNTSITSLNAGLDGQRLDNTTRDTFPLVSGLLSSGQVQHYVEFSEDATHTLDLYEYTNAVTEITSVVFDVIRIGDIGGSEGILSLPVASKTELGTVKAGEYLNVDEDGTLNVALDGSDGTIITTNNNSRLRDGKYNVTAVNHRGYSTDAPENTLPAYIMSKEKGFNYAECDVSFTSDGIAVLLHDSTIDRTSNGSGSISNMTYQQLLQYDFGSWKSSEYTGTKIPTFAEFIELCKNIGLHPYIELKSNGSYTQDQIVEIVNLVKKNGMRGNVTYISFNKDYLEYVKQADRHARLGYLTDITQTILESAKSLRTGLNEVYIGADYSGLTDAKVNMCIDENFPLEIWTVNDADVIRNMNSYISGVTSDYLIAGQILTEDLGIVASDETDPTVPSHVKNITEEDIEKWNNNSGGVIEETDPTVPSYIKSITEADIEKWNNNSGGGLTEETDPTVPEHVKNITVEDIENWNNNSGGGIAEETDPTVPQYIKDITEEDILGWNSGSNPEIAVQEETPEDEEIVLWVDPSEVPTGFTDEISMDSEYITVTLNEYGTSNVDDTKINYNKIVEDKSSGKLSLVNGEIVIGSGVNCVRVTAQVGIQNQNSGYDQKRLSLYVNDVKTQVAYGMAYSNQYAVGHVTITRLLEVKEGDRLSLYAGYASNKSSVLKDEFNIFNVEICNNKKAYISENHVYNHYYSYQEQFVGRWVDGSSLYEKTIYIENLDLTTEGFKYIPHYVENIKQVVDFKYREQCSDIVYGEDEYGDFSNEMFNSVLKAWAFNKKYIRLYNDAWNNVSNWYFTIQYTKKDTEEEVSS